MVEEAEDAAEEEPKKKPHTPGRGHRRKSGPPKKIRIGNRLKKKHEKRKKEARIKQKMWDELPPDLRKLLDPKDMKIPEDEQ